MTRAPISAAHLARLVDGATVSGPPALITGLHHDSRQIGPGDLFVALDGARAKGSAFVAQALQAGAAAVAVGPGVALPPLSVPVIRLPAPRRDMGDLAAALYGYPTKAMHTFGVTGTNGKTTVTRILGAMCQAGGVPAGLIGTVGHCLLEGDRVTPLGAGPAAHHTTPESPDLQAMLHEMVEGGAALCAMEVSSVGLTESRLRGIRFNVGAFLNLSPDHLDYHGTMAEYGDAKALLFSEHLKVGAVAIINVDDPFGARLAGHVEREHITWRLGTGPQADVRYEALQIHEQGISGNLETPAGPLLVESTLMGRFNADNIATAAAAALALGLPIHAIEEGMYQAVVPGRMQQIPTELGFTVLVDYAHTPDALTRVVDAARAVTSGVLWCVFGCGGDRDPGKRPLMGRAAAEADGVIITSDNPRTEDPVAIAEAAALGAEDAGRPRAPSPTMGRTWLQLDRRAAIEGALRAAQPGDTIIIAGKGHEAYQEINGVRHDFDDAAVAEAILAQLAEEAGE